jgi:ribosomal protein S18 acetylase RimI-like enzyme
MRIRTAREEDAGSIAAVYLVARAEMAYLPRLHTATETRAWIEEVILVECDVLVADDGGRVVGFEALGDEVLEQLYVHPSAQGQGLGARLLAEAKERRAAGLRLWVFQRNERARRFYERHGFVCLRLTDGEENEEGEPDALYEWLPAGNRRAA